MMKHKNFEQKSKLSRSVEKTLKTFYSFLPMILGVVLLIAMLNVLVPKTFYSKIFTGNLFIDLFGGSLLGSILAGSPVTSYIIGGEFLKQGIDLRIITTFIVSWVTVSLVQLPAEIVSLGKRFAISRNLSAFFLSIVVAIITVWLVNVL